MAVAVAINSVYHDASMIPLCSDKRNSFWFCWMDAQGRVCVCKQGVNLSFDASVTKSRNGGILTQIWLLLVEGN